MNFEELNKHTGNAILPEDLDLTLLEFKPLKEYVGEEIVIRGFFISNGQFGEQVAVYARTKREPGGIKINIPKRYVEQFRLILNDTDSKVQILNGNVKMVNIKTVKTKKGQDSVSFEFKNC